MDPGFLLSGRYRIEELIGRGSQSSVYRATDEVLGREVAVKLFRDGAVDEERTRRQSDEVRILAGMAHHALVTLFDAGADLSDPDRRLSYLVMELVRGPDLRRRSAEGPLSAAHMALIGHDLADGLAHIHHHGIIHRDVKPANILLVDYSAEDRRPRAKLSDFGVAITIREGHHGDPDDSSGTPAYLSPEQAAGEPAGPASDVYSLGLVLLEGLTGKMAYPGAPVQSALARLLHDPDIPEELAPMWVALLTSMLDRDPAARPPAREVSLALRQEVINGAGRHRRDAAALLTDEEGRMQAVERYRILDTPRTAPSTGSRRWPHACSRCPWRSSVSWTMTASGSRPTTARTSRKSAGTPGCAPPPSCRAMPGSSGTPPTIPGRWPTRSWPASSACSSMPGCRCALRTATTWAPSASWTVSPASSAMRTLPRWRTWPRS